jgi:multicomponent Na+:H+ antiporter subunit E
MLEDMDDDTDDNRRRSRRFLIAFTLIAVLWYVLSDGDLSSWKLGVPAAMAAALLVALQPLLRPVRVSLSGTLHFLAFFIVQSVRGGIDVALRALRPSLPLAPGLVDYATRLPRGPARTFLVAVIGLLPGTLTVRISGDRLTVHVLDKAMPVMASLAQLEQRIAGMFGIEIDQGARE